jgi:methionyl aminopeptidase
MSIETPAELERLRAIGAIVARTLQTLAAAVRPGVTTSELSELGAKLLTEQGARSSPPMVYGFPGAVCISVNDEVVHGIPGDRAIRPGDLVKLDLTAMKDGFHADSAMSVNVPPVNRTAEKLARCAERAFRKALRVARAGHRVNEIGRMVDREVRSSGFRVVRELCGHGVGRTIHEEPSVPNYCDPLDRGMLTEGLVITIEPIIAAGSGEAELQPDGWTVCTGDGSLAAHYEHTIVITKGEPILLTAA